MIESGKNVFSFFFFFFFDKDLFSKGRTAACYSNYKVADCTGFFLGGGFNLLECGKKDWATLIG